MADLHDEHRKPRPVEEAGGPFRLWIFVIAVLLGVALLALIIFRYVIT